MMTLNEHALVDACVAQSYGFKSERKLEELKSIIDELSAGTVGIAMSPELRREWKIHATRFMTAWLAKMTSRRRVRWVRDRRVSDFRMAAEKYAENDGERAAIEKDAHITEAAILAGLGVISLDDNQRRLLRKVAAEYQTVGRVQWFNPSRECEECLTWLRSGGVDRRLNRLVDTPNS